MAKRAHGTVLEMCVRKRGVHRGAITAAHVAQWGAATADLGHVPTTAEYAEWANVDERTGWRHRAGIREVFGDHWQDVIQLVADEIERRALRSPREITALPAH